MEAIDCLSIAEPHMYYITTLICSIAGRINHIRTQLSRSHSMYEACGIITESNCDRKEGINFDNGMLLRIPIYVSLECEFPTWWNECFGCVIMEFNCLNTKTDFLQNSKQSSGKRTKKSNIRWSKQFRYLLHMHTHINCPWVCRKSISRLFRNSNCIKLLSCTQKPLIRTIFVVIEMWKMAFSVFRYCMRNCILIVQ